MSAVLIPELQSTFKQGGSIPDIRDLHSFQPSAAELLTEQRIQAAAIKDHVQQAEVRDAQILPQGYATPEGTTFGVLDQFKRGGAIPDAKPPTLTPFLLVIGVAWVLGLAARRRR